MFGWCLDAPCTNTTQSILCQTKGVSICPHTCGCPLYINNRKKACFVRLRGCPYAAHTFGCPICLDAPLYVWLPHCMFGCCQMYGGIQRYEGHPVLWGVSKHIGASKHMEYPNVWGHMDTPSVWQSMLSFCFICTAGIQASSKHMGASKHVGVSIYKQIYPSYAICPIECALMGKGCKYMCYIWSHWH